MIPEFYQLFTQQSSTVLAQTITGVATTLVSTNDINLKATPFRDIAVGPRPIYVVAQVGTSFTGGGSVTVSLQQSANAGAGAYTTIFQVGVIPALAVVGASNAIIINAIAANVITQQYLSVLFTFNGGALATGAVAAFLTPDPDVRANYGVNYSVATK